MVLGLSFARKPSGEGDTAPRAATGRQTTEGPTGLSPEVSILGIRLRYERGTVRNAGPVQTIVYNTENAGNAQEWMWDHTFG